MEEKCKKNRCFKLEMRHVLPLKTDLLPEHSTKENGGCCLFFCLSIKPDWLFESLNQVIGLHRGAAIWNAVSHNTQLRVGDCQEIRPKKHEVALEPRDQNHTQKQESIPERTELRKELNRIDKKERQAPKNGGNCIILVLVSSISAFPGKINTRKKKKNSKMRSFLGHGLLNMAFCFIFREKKTHWKLAKG